MISNLTIRSNLIESLRSPAEESDKAQMDAPLARISAMDLNELCGLYIYRTNYLDQRNIERKVDGLPTSEQQKQWASYLFYGDMAVSMKKENRSSAPWIELSRIVISQWDIIEPVINEELAIECLCIIRMAKKLYKKNSITIASMSLKRLESISAIIERSLTNREINQRVHDRIDDILAFIDC